MDGIDTLIADMRTGLEGVRPGPWEYFAYEPSGRCGPGCDAHMVNATGDQVIDCKWASATEEGERTYKHIARCSPDNIRALLDEIERLRAARHNTILVPRKVLAEAHAAMRATGWQLAPDNPTSDDGVLEAAVAGIEQAFAKLLHESETECA